MSAITAATITVIAIMVDTTGVAMFTPMGATHMLTLTVMLILIIILILTPILIMGILILTPIPFLSASAGVAGVGKGATVVTAKTQCDRAGSSRHGSALAVRRGPGSH
jgi:hypothetical protein